MSDPAILVRSKDGSFRGKRGFTKNPIHFPVAVKGGQWLDFGIFGDSEGEWLTGLTARKLVAHTSLERWAHEPCRFLLTANGRPRAIRSKKAEPPARRNHPKVRVYFKADCQQIKDGLNRDANADKADAERYLTDAEAKEIHHVPSEFCRMWAKRKSRLRPQQAALRTRQIRNPNPHGPTMVTGFRESDLQEILAGNEGKFPGMGKGANAAAIRAKKHRQAVDALPIILPEGARLSPSEVFTRAKKDHGLTPWYVRAAFKELRGQSEVTGRQGERGTIGTWRLPPTAYANQRHASNGQAVGNGTPAPVNGKKRGRPKKQESQQLADFCLLQKEAGKSSKEVARNVRKQFNRPHFSEKQARAYAIRGQKRS